MAALIVRTARSRGRRMKIHPSAAYAELGRQAAEAGIPLISDGVHRFWSARDLPRRRAGWAATGGNHLPFQGAHRRNDAARSHGGCTVPRRELRRRRPSQDALHGHSYTGNALACRVALESLRVFEDELFRRRVSNQGWFSEQLRQFAGHPAVEERGASAASR